ncbi:RRM_1 domain-containing protein [Cephalotus follicularis]|uniref:RRM_1 domain-containing protein n=1 Tax=Cephalotus follicularis TaxID=3775 RepID=A0A1Q3BLN6_CEPFO|nr:RRM_1 domain-containing protein [Cephalotus follicularis]
MKIEEGEGGDQMDHFHRNEAISAVAEDAFLGEEIEEDDYEDLYNDVNVGEGFLQFQHKKNDDDLAIGDDIQNQIQNQNDVADVDVNISKKLDSQSPVVAPNIGGVGENHIGVGEADFRVSGNLGFRGHGVGGPVQAQHPSAPVGGGSGGGLRVELGQGIRRMSDLEEQNGINNNNNTSSVAGVQGQQIHGGSGVVGTAGNEGFMRQGGGGGGGGGGGIVVVGGSVNGVGNGGGGVGNVGGGGGGGTILFVGDLHWWTTDAELETELVKYGAVKEVKFFDEKASGKSKGYCQVEFYDPGAATTCKEGMNGHLFNGRPCVVAYASPYSVKRMGEAQANRNQQVAQQALAQARRGPNDVGGRPGGGNNIATGGNFQGGENNRGFGRGNWGRGNQQGMGNRGPVGPMRNRGPGGMGGRGIMGNGGNGFGQGISVTPPLLHHQSMMGQGFDPAFGAPIGRMGSYGGFPGAPTPFSGVLSSFPPVGGVGLPGVAPHVNPAFFGRGMPMSSMGMMPTSGVDGPNMGMWSDPSMGGWGNEEHGGGRAAESSYGEEAASDHQYGEASHDRGGWQNTKEKDRASERDWSGSSDRRYRDDRELVYDRDMPREKDMGDDHDWPERRHRDDRDFGREREKERDRDRERSRDGDRDRERDRDRDRERYREDRERYADHHRYRDREAEHDDDWDRGRSSRTHSKSRISQEDDHRSRSRDADYGKRRRLTSE